MPTDTPIDWSKSSDKPEGTEEVSTEDIVEEETSTEDSVEEENELSKRDLSLIAQREAQAKISRNISGG